MTTFLTLAFLIWLAGLFPATVLLMLALRSSSVGSKELFAIAIWPYILFFSLWMILATKAAGYIDARYPISKGLKNSYDDSPLGRALKEEKESGS